MCVRVCVCVCVCFTACRKRAVLINPPPLPPPCRHHILTTWTRRQRRVCTRAHTRAHARVIFIEIRHRVHRGQPPFAYNHSGHCATSARESAEPSQPRNMISLTLSHSAPCTHAFPHPKHTYSDTHTHTHTHTHTQQHTRRCKHTLGSRQRQVHE